MFATCTDDLSGLASSFDDLAKSNMSDSDLEEGIENRVTILLSFLTYSMKVRIIICLSICIKRLIWYLPRDPLLKGGGGLQNM